MNGDGTTYAWQVQENGEWNIIGAFLPDGNDVLALVTTRFHVHEKLQGLAEAHYAMTGKPVRSVKLTVAEVLQEFDA